MMRKISKRTIDYRVEWFLEWAGPEGRGYSFPCDEYGVVNPNDISTLGLENLRDCLNGEMEEDGYVGPKINKRVYKDRVPALGLCECGIEVTLRHRENKCWGCGILYNLFGQRLTREIPRDEMEGLV